MFSIQSLKCRDSLKPVSDHASFYSKMPARRKTFQNTEESEDIFQSPKKKKKATNNNKKDKDELKVNSLFGELVNKAGFILKKGDQPNLLSMLNDFVSIVCCL